MLCWDPDWRLPIHNFRHDFDIVAKLPSSTILTDILSWYMPESWIASVLDKFVPIGMCYFMSADTFMVQTSLESSDMSISVQQVSFLTSAKDAGQCTSLLVLTP